MNNLGSKVFMAGTVFYTFSFIYRIYRKKF